MDWQSALELVVAHTRAEAYRERCADAHPDREVWRARMLAKAAALEGKSPPEYPPLMQQAAGLAGAVGRAVAAAARGLPVLAPAGERERRLAICRPCEHNGERGNGGIRCTLCGCTGAKAHLARESCPLDPPKWGPCAPPEPTPPTPGGQAPCRA